MFAERRRLLQRMRSADRQRQTLQARLQRLNARRRRLESCRNRSTWLTGSAGLPSERVPQDGSSILASGQPLLATDSTLRRWRIRLRLIQRLRSEFEQCRARRNTESLDAGRSIDALRSHFSQLRRLCPELGGTASTPRATSLASGNHEPCSLAELQRCADQIDSVLKRLQASQRWTRLSVCIPHLLPMEQHAQREIQRLLQQRVAGRRQRQQIGEEPWCREEIEILKRRAARIAYRLRVCQPLRDLAATRLKLSDVEHRLSRAWRSRWSASENLRSPRPLEHALWSIHQRHPFASVPGQHQPSRPLLLDEPIRHTDRLRDDHVLGGIRQLADFGVQVLYFTSRWQAAEALAHAGAQRVVCSGMPLSNASSELLAGADNRPSQVSVQRDQTDTVAATAEPVPIVIELTGPAVSFHSGAHYLELSSSISECPAVDSRLANRFAELGIDTAQELLELKPDMFAIDAPELELGPIALFSIQAQTRLMCQIPMLDTRAARVLVGCGVTCPRQLCEQNAADLLRSVTAGIRSGPAAVGLTMAERQAVLRETPAWIRRARRSRSLWDLRHNPPSGTMTSGIRNRSGLNRSVTRSFLSLVEIDVAEPAADVFLLQARSPVDLVPGVDHSHVQRLRSLGIQTAGELIEADVSLMEQASVAREIDVGQVQAWQQRARLACQVPGLPAVDVCLLVACGVSDIASLASADTDRLLAALRALVNTSQADTLTTRSASRIPGRQQVAEWIQVACRTQRRNAA